MRLIKKLLAISLFASNIAFAYDFKGIEVGAKVDRDTIADKLGVRCMDSKQEPGGFCFGETTITQTKAEVHVNYDADNIVERISLTFSPDSFGTVKAALIEKFGKPDSDKTDKVQNGMGAIFEQNTVTWLKNGDMNGDMMYLHKYGKTVTESKLVIVSKASVKKTMESAAKRKGDI